MKNLNELISSAVITYPQRRLNRGECTTFQGKNCPLCFASRINYDQERKAKKGSLKEYWKSAGLPDILEEIIFSPMGRNYRTVSKRKAFHTRRGVQLGLIGVSPDEEGTFPITISQCAIEPVSHAKLYKAVEDFLKPQELKDISEMLNYVIIKGTYDELTLIFNLSAFDPFMRKGINALSKHLTELEKTLQSIYVFIDERRSKYYLSNRKPPQLTGEKILLRKVFGKSEIFQEAAGTKYLYSPISFSQTNFSMVETFVITMKDLLAVKPDETLYDLYCGYGLFSLAFARSAKQVIGAEISGQAVRDAIANAERMKLTNCRFVKQDISPETILSLLPIEQTPHAVLLDPPRSGTKPGVIEALAQANPRAVVHIFCNVEIIQNEIERWKEKGYEIKRAIPFDMFPGTKDMEIAVLLEKV